MGSRFFLVCGGFRSSEIRWASLAVDFGYAFLAFLELAGRSREAEGALELVGIVLEFCFLKPGLVAFFGSVPVFLRSFEVGDLKSLDSLDYPPLLLGEPEN